MLWVVGLLLVTLGGRPRAPSGLVFFNWVPFGAQSAVSRPEIVLNLLLFAPAGLLLPWILLRVGRWGLAAGGWRLVLVSVGGAFLLSSLIEITQAFTPLGTAGDLTDILLNTTGCALAAVVAGKLSEVVGRKRYEIRSDSAGRVGG
ncbi:VanZ family protein [Kribbella sp. NPDC006257]|uniref:VanZ family protein n=1 Tax=Kribbella sp. NPDC006257 TaxID=3156738 RepID=UPI00339F01D2